MSKILVVDDQPDNVFILQDRLENEGYEVVTAYDGPSGIEKTLSENPDLVLLDVMMPGMSGFEACKLITENEATKDIPVILITALTSVEDIKEGLNAGAFDYIKKPFNKTELLARIKSALRFRETNLIYLEIEKIKTYAATIVTANHEIKQPLTLINLSVSAIRRELSKDDLNREAILKRVDIIDNAAKSIIEILEKLSAIKKPKFTDYVNNTQMIDINEESENKKDKLN